MRYLIDTNHLSPMITAGHRLRIRILEALEAGDEFYIAVPVISEFLFGLLLLPRAVTNEAEWKQIEPEFGYIGVDKEDAIQAAKLRAWLRRHGKQLGFVDALIAVIALRNDLTLLTTDQDFAVIPQLMCENWLL